MRSVAVIFAALFVRCCLSLDLNDFVTCEANMICSQTRGKINFDWWQLNIFERQPYNSRSWTIKPNDGVESTITIVFKNFNVLENVFIAIQSGDDILWKKVSWNLGRNYEYAYKNVTSLTVYVPREERGSFDAFFYVGCEVLTSSAGEATFPSAGDFNFDNGRCWIVEPLGMRDLSRLYFTFRDVYLKEGSQVTVKDLHTDEQVATMTGSSQYDIYETNMLGQETFLIELTCGDQNEKCSSFGNIFSMSYYSLGRREVACVEMKRQCAFGPTKLPTAMCQQSCPKLDQILQDELEKEGPVYNPQTPVVKSGAFHMRAQLVRRVSKKVNETQEQERLQKEKEEKERKEREEKERIEREKKEREEAQRATPAWNCQLPEEYCKCMNNMTEIRRYCFSKQKCNVFKSCTMGCIIARVFVCAKVTSSARIELFGG